MKKSLFFFAASALALTACTSENDVLQSETQQQSGPQAVMFDTYVPNVTRTDAWIGKYGAMTTTTLKAAEGDGGGFGVFATYSDGTPGAYAASQGPNFMYNQLVKWNSTSLGWEYSPLKYWPNETKNDSQDPQATMDSRVDKLTFFAYAPYVASAAAAADAAVGDLKGVAYTTHTPDADQYGIIKITANNATTDPKVTYRVSKDATKTVDLLWGVAPAGGLNYETVDPAYIPAVVTPPSPAKATLTVSEGLPLINLIKPNKDQKMKFLFRHALSRINFTVVGAFDQIAPGGSKDANTKVLVEQVDVYEKVAGSIKTDGVLNLNNTTAWTALWETPTGGDYTSSPLFTVTKAELTASIKDGGDVAFASQPDGVTTAETPLFADATKFFAVIPNNGTQFVFEITYYVQTVDAALKATGSVDGSRVKNVVRVPVTIDLKNNKSYNFRLILGLTSVKLAAEVADWELAGDVDANLPRNND
jgi:hypothetical protein